MLLQIRPILQGFSVWHDSRKSQPYFEQLFRKLRGLLFIVWPHVVLVSTGKSWVLWLIDHLNLYVTATTKKWGPRTQPGSRAVAGSAFLFERVFCLFLLASGATCLRARRLLQLLHPLQQRRHDLRVFFFGFREAQGTQLEQSDATHKIGIS